MSVDQKNKRPTAGTDTKSATQKGPAGEDQSAEKLKKQHRVNLDNAGALVRHALDTVRKTGVDKALFEILKTVRHWPSPIDKPGFAVFEPAFEATDISARTTTQDGDTVISTSFTYSGETYDFVARIRESSSPEFTLGTISLCENGVKVISMETVQDLEKGMFSFRELSTFKYGKWIENIVLIEEEIKRTSGQ